MLTFRRDSVPNNWCTYCDEVSDNFRVINPKDFRAKPDEGVPKKSTGNVSDVFMKRQPPKAPASAY